MVTRNDVAKKAGVSVAVVSYVMNNKPNVKPETRAKVLNAMEELGYLPNLTARSLKTKKTNQLAVLLNYLGNPFEAGLLLHLEAEARERGLSLTFKTHDREREAELKLLAVDGLIIVGQALQEDILHFFAERKFPVVSVTKPVCTTDRFPVPYVDIDWVKAYGDVMDRLLHRGRSRIAFMTHGDERSHLHHRFEAFGLAAAERGVNIGSMRVLSGGGRYETARSMMIEKYKKDELPFDAIVCANDLMAIGTLSAIKEMGHTVPESLSVIGSEDILMTRETSPGISCIQFPRAEAAKQVLTLFDRAKNNSEAESKSKVLVGSWVPRES